MCGLMRPEVIFLLHFARHIAANIIWLLIFPLYIGTIALATLLLRYAMVASWCAMARECTRTNRHGLAVSLIC